MGGFFFFKWKRNQAESDAIRFLMEQEVERLMLMSTIPVGTKDMVNLSGNPVVWDQTMLDDLDMFLAATQAKLDALP